MFWGIKQHNSPNCLQISDPVATSIKGKAIKFFEIQNGKPNSLKSKEIFNKLSPSQQVCWSVPDKIEPPHGSSHYHYGTWLSFVPRRFLRWPTTTQWWSILTAHSQYGQRDMGRHKSEMLLYFSTSDILTLGMVLHEIYKVTSCPCLLVYSQYIITFIVHTSVAIVVDNPLIANDAYMHQIIAYM